MYKLRFTTAAVFLSLSLPLVAAPLITEFMASNNSALFDEDADSSDWIEIHNPDATAADLTGYYLTDDAAELAKWRLPSISLPAGGYLIVFASNKDRDVGELHTDFRLSPSAGGYLALVAADGATPVSEFVAYPEQFEDFSYGRAQTGGATTEVLVREGDACKILVPTSDIGTSWQGLGFDDATWDDGTTGVGYEAGSGYENLLGPGGSVRAETEDINSTVYVRIPFSITSKDGMAELQFRMKYDDGFIAYLNGTEIASGNKPANPTWNSDAVSDHPDAQAEQFVDTDITAEIGGALVVGNNVLAIHGMNGGIGSSDLLALPRLEAGVIAEPGDLGDLGYFQDSSPSTANGTDQGLPAGVVTVSQPGRGFTGTLSITLSTSSPAAQIRYTTNGGLPTASSTLYTGGNINISSSTLLRARAFESGLTPGEAAEEGYIRLSSAGQSFSSDIPVVVMERFGSSGPTASNGKAFTFFAFFEPDPGTGRTTLNRPYNLGTRGGWKVRGSSSSGFAKKAFSIEAWDESNGNKNIAPLGFPEESDFVLNARSQFDRSLMRNAWIYELSNQVGRYAVRTKFVELFKDDNGGDLYSSSNDYAGVYTFMEKIARDKERVDVERLPQSINTEPGITGGYMMKVDRLDPGDAGLGAGGRSLGWVYPKEEDVTAAQTNWLRDHLNDMNASLTTPDYADYIDVQSWVDHHLLNVLTQNADALRLSTYFHKKRGGKVEFGPIWDFDRSAHSTDGRDANATSWSGGTAYFTYPWWGSLFDDENFWQAYIDRYTELRDGAWATSNVHSIIDVMAADLSEAQVRNFQRWTQHQPRFGGYTGEVNDLKSWLGTRLNWMDGQFAPRPTTNRNSGVYSAGTTVALSATLGANQKIYYTLDGSDPRPNSERTTLVGTELFDETAPARALVPNSDIGTAWRTDLDFVETGWLSGQNRVGYERSGAGTYDTFIDIDVDAQMSNRTSCFIRIKFDVAAADLATANFMSLQMRYDDGFVAYLNGTQIVSDRAPGGVTWQSSATQTHDDGPAVNFQDFEANSFLNLLTPGENLLAIHALNESTGSSDFLNQSKLLIGFDENGGPGGIMGTEYTGPITLTETARLVARVFDADGGHATNSGQTPIGSGWSAPLTAEYLVDEMPAGAGDLEITEIMADPYSSEHPEWIEITNVSSGVVSLTDLSFSDGIEFTFPGLSLAAGASAVITDDPAGFLQIYGTPRAALVAGTFTGGLANAGEMLTLVAADTAVIQTFAFPPTDEAGRTLVADGGGWRAGRSLLGSPGVAEPTAAQVPDIFVNEILTYFSGAERLDSVELSNPNATALDFSGWFLTTDLAQPTMHPLDGLSIGAGDELVLNSELIAFDLPSTGGEIYLIAGATDGARLDYVDGFVFGDASKNRTFGRHVTSVGDVFYPVFIDSLNLPNNEPIATRLAITEIMYNPSAGGIEYIEIVNNSTSETISLANVELEGIGFTFSPAAVSLSPGGVILVVGGDPETFRDANLLPPALPIFGPFPGTLDNGGETLRVQIPEPGEAPTDPDVVPTWDHVRYDDDAPWPAEADGTGESLHRIVFATSIGFGSDPASWESGPPTPGSVGDSAFDWRALFFTAAEIADPAISGPLADADGDKFSNIIEYLLGSDPRDGSDSLPPSAEVVDGFIEFSFTLRDGVGDYTAEIESSTELQSWAAAGDFALT
ncbi:MAG: hypothetical protein ACI9NC_003861, partial [Verrucomicrobiales bacterium]